MLQPDLFGAQRATVPEPRKLARTSNPTTSKLAATSVVHFAGEHHAAIVQVLRERGAHGLTVHEIATFCRLDAHAIGKRMAELEAEKIVEVVRQRDANMILRDVTRKTPSGRQARVWKLAGGER